MTEKRVRRGSFRIRHGEPRLFLLLQTAMSFVECAFLATNEPQIGCSIKSIYPAEYTKILDQSLESILYPRGILKPYNVGACAFCHSQYIRFLVSKKIETSLSNVEFKTQTFDAVVEMIRKNGPAKEAIVFALYRVKRSLITPFFLSRLFFIKIPSI